LNCKICNPPSTKICPSCEAEIRLMTAEIVRKVRGMRKVVAGLDGRKMLAYESKKVYSAS
jgi:hypothetical protein